MRNSIKRTCFLFVLLLVAFTVTNAQNNESKNNEQQPAVIKAVAPKQYPPIAVAAKAEGKVIIEVNINSSGKVSSTNVISGHPLLKAVAVEAAKRWLFVSHTQKERVVNITFSFKVGVKKEDAGIFFLPLYEIEIVSVLPELNYSKAN